MRRIRRTVGIDAELVEELKSIARARGMSLANYLRKLIQEALLIESMGYFAPRALSEKRTELILSKLGFTLIPYDLVSNNLSEEDAEAKGISIGKALRELDIDPTEVIEMLSLDNQLAITQGESLIILPQSNRLKKLLASLIRGIAKGSGLSVSTSGNIIIINLRK